MKRLLAAVFWAALTCVGCATTGGGLDRAVIRAKDNVAPALVHIRPVKEVFAGGERKEVIVVGSGFIIHPEGYVVTNEHVAGKEDQVRCVLSNKEELAAQVVGVDPEIDIAVLKLVSDRKDFPSVKLGDSSKVTAGQTVLALGSPHGLARSVSRGIISVTDRYLGEGDEMRSSYFNWIQTDAAINRGNSGGPLVDLHGKVIGINTRKDVSADNVGFAIPITIAKESVDQIIRTGRVTRSWIGVTLQEMMSKTDDPAQRGVVVAFVEPFSPAKEAGIQPGDVLLSVNGVSTDARFVEDLPAVQKTLASLPLDAPVAVRVTRDGEELDVPVTPVERRQLEGEQRELDAWGFTAAELTPEVIRRAQLASTQGAWVSGVMAGTIAANARLQHGDVILSIDNEPVQSLTDLMQKYKSLTDKAQPRVLLQVKRGALTRYVLLKQPEAQSGAAPEQQPEEEQK